MAAIGNTNNSYFGDVYMGFENDGLFYANPASYKGFFTNSTTDGSCLYNSKRNPQFDPRCRPWYIQTKNTSSAINQNVVLTEPYQLINTLKLGQSACNGI